MNFTAYAYIKIQTLVGRKKNKKINTFPSGFLPIKCSQIQKIFVRWIFFSVLHVLKVAIHNLKVRFIQLELKYVCVCVHANACMCTDLHVS